MYIMGFVPVLGNYDAVVKDIIKKSPNAHVSWFLAASYAYYIADESLLSDSFYDKICVWLIENQDQITHVHKDIIPWDSLRSGSGFTLRREDYPLIVQNTAEAFIRDLCLYRNMNLKLETKIS